jgi:hypothetical protein
MSFNIQEQACFGAVAVGEILSLELTTWSPRYGNKKYWGEHREQQVQMITVNFNSTYIF